MESELIAKYKEYGSLSTKELKKLGSKYQLLTDTKLSTIPPGSHVIIIWSGGNGPHEYIVHENNLDYKEYPDRCVVVKTIDWNGNPYGLHSVSFVGNESPYTMVWLKSIPK